MSAQTILREEISRNYPDLQTSDPSNTAQLRGRAVERINITDPEGLDPAIRKYSELPDESTVLSVAILVAFAIVAIGAIAAGIMIAPWMLPLVLFPGYLAITVPVECMAHRARNLREQKVKELEACKQAMANPEFQIFAKLVSGPMNHSVDEILAIHRMFKDYNEIQKATQKLERDKARFAKEFASAVKTA